jgi:hypothetical protein
MAAARAAGRRRPGAEGAPAALLSAMTRPSPGLLRRLPRLLRLALLALPASALFLLLLTPCQVVAQPNYQSYVDSAGAVASQPGASPGNEHMLRCELRFFVCVFEISLFLPLPARRRAKRGRRLLVFSRIKSPPT